jgi:hypothetical protein
LYIQAGSQTFEAKSTDVAESVGYTEMRRQLNATRSCDSCISYAAAGWVPIGTLPNPGADCECQSGCKCTVEYRKAKPEESAKAKDKAKPEPTPKTPSTPKSRPEPKPKPSPKPRSKPTSTPSRKPEPKTPAVTSPPHTDPTLKAHQDHVKTIREDVHNPEVLRYAVEAGTTPGRWREQMGKQLQTAVDQGEFYVRVPREVVPGLIQDGRWKTQHETSGSRGAYLPEYRAQIEGQLFGTRPETQPRERPVYGYVSQPQFATAGKAVEQGIVSTYGEVVVRLKDSVRDRTTITVGDSLTRLDSLAGTPARKVTTDAMPLDRADFKAIAPTLYNAKPGDALKILERGISYVEAQYHGGLTLSDVAEIAFPTRPSREIQDALNREGIAWRVKRTRAW